jgi:hypothetical protein
MMTDNLEEGDPLFVPSIDVGLALSLGASFVEGDSRLYIPKPLPDGVSIENFSRWTTQAAKVTWISELLGALSNMPDSVLDFTGTLLRAEGHNSNDFIRLYVPESDGDLARVVPGVRWSRIERMYIANRSADLDLVFPYLTDEARAVWAIERNLRSEVSALVKSQAMIVEKEVWDPKDQPEHERERPLEKKEE